MIEDTEKRIDVLIEKLALKGLSEEVVCQVCSIITCNSTLFKYLDSSFKSKLVFIVVNSNDFMSALDRVGILMTSQSEESRWLVGLKRLCEILSR